jgi:membrane-associated phospholipid phosphatase
MPVKLAVAMVAFPATLALSLPAASAESPYRLESSEEWVWMGAGLSLCVGGLIWAHSVDPLTSAQIQALDADDINSLDRRTMRPFRDDHAGDVLGLTSFLLPLAFLTRDDMRDDANTLGAMWAEATIWSEGLAQVTKSIAKRTRPYVYDPDAPAELKTQTEARLSFYSAHATSSAMNCFLMAKTFSDYSDNHGAEMAMWTGAVVYPVLTGFFRVDSGHHFTTDAIVGVVIGAAVGYLVPALHHRDDDASGTPESASGGVSFTATFSF